MHSPSVASQRSHCLSSMIVALFFPVRSFPVTMQSSLSELSGSSNSSNTPLSSSLARSMICAIARSELRHEVTSAGPGSKR